MKNKPEKITKAATHSNMKDIVEIDNHPQYDMQSALSLLGISIIRLTSPIYTMLFFWGRAYYLLFGGLMRAA